MTRRVAASTVVSGHECELSGSAPRRARARETGHEIVRKEIVRKEPAMATITPDDIRVLAKSELVEPVIAIVGDDALIVDAEEVDFEDVIYTREMLVSDFGEDITDAEADVLAAGLTAQTSEST
jgi:hypothetical protein